MKKNTYMTMMASLITIAAIMASEKEPTDITQKLLRVLPVEQVQRVEVNKYYDVPLSEEIQDHIFSECDKYGIAPTLIIAIIERESRFDLQAVGDSGRSKGCMQIQERWHKKRMKRLGCTDLMDPYQNITVGIDIISELKEMNEDLYWVLMAYNGGIGYANKMLDCRNYSDYALWVSERSMELERGLE